MLSNRQASSLSLRRKSCWSTSALPWTLVAFLSIISLGALFQLQLVSREAARVRTRLKTLEQSNESDSNLYRTKLAQTDVKVAGFLQERDKMLASQKEFTEKVNAAETKAKNSTDALANAIAQAKAAEEKFHAAEAEIKEITVEAGRCKEQYNSLNAKCATMKQGLANLGLNSQTVEQKTDGLSGSVEGALDPRAGMEAALVLKETSQQPWKVAEERNKAAEATTTDSSAGSEQKASKESSRHMRAY